MTEQAEEIQEPAEQPEVSQAEVDAREKGWTDIDEWKESGKEEDKWVTAKHFNERGSWFTQRKTMEQTIADGDKRVADNNKYHKANLEETINELNEKKSDLVELADKDGVKEIDKKIDSVKDEIESLKPSAPSQDSIKIENDYLSSLDTRSKKATANQICQEILSTNNLSGQALVDAVKAEMTKEFPEVNHNREKSTTDKSTASSGKGSRKYSSVKQLKGQDAKIAQSFENSGMTEKQILSILNDKEK